MTTEEFSNGFDILVNSYSVNLPFGMEDTHTMTFNEYEKSVFLTKAQQELVVNLYNGKNIYGDSFELTEELRRYLDGLVKTEVYNGRNKSDNNPKGKETDESILSKKSSESPKYSTFFKLPENLAFITMEQITYGDEELGCYNGHRANVYPVTQDEYARVKDNPFRGPTKYKAIRLDYGSSIVEIISKFQISNYLIKYLSKPSPIILIDLPDDLTIENSNKKTECTLNPILHQAILERAVTLGVQSKQLGSVNTTTTTTSTTNNN